MENKKNNNKKTNDIETITKVNGEIVDIKHSKVKEDDALIVIHKTASQLNAYEQKKDLDKAMKEFISLNMGSYIHFAYKYRTPILQELQNKAPGNNSNIHIIRFMVLSSYSTFGGKLFDSNRNRIKKSSLKNIWDVANRNSINETYNILKECGYIYESKEGYLMINENIIAKGSMDNFKTIKTTDNDLTYTRVFTENLLDMYYNTEPKQRKQLANFFKALSYINFKHNVFCSNPKEIDESKLELLSWTDLAKLCGYEEKKNIAKFKKDLRSLIVGDDIAIGQFDTIYGRPIVVNPKVYYSGDNVEDLKSIINLFDICKKK